MKRIRNVRNLIRIIALLVISIYVLSILARNCNQGNQKENKPTPESVDSNSSANKDISNNAGADPNEIIGTKSYNALGDTLQWVAATASLPYTIYFENDPELATSAAQKVEIRHAYYLIMN